MGIVGLVSQKDYISGKRNLWVRFLQLLSGMVNNLIDQQQSKRQLTHLNTYFNVSSMLSQPLGLHEILEAVLYCSMDVVSAEASSILLLDDDKQNFLFYQTEGPAKPTLDTITFPIDKGIAGSVFQAQKGEIINDVVSDPRFFTRIDSETGFHTKNMIALPLTAGEEQVGVLEVINKVDGDEFTDDELMLLESIAAEIAFAIRNARIFEYVADSYCLQRQGLVTCRGCQRPLGTWTPCVKYRERLD
jgi:signal transduction protein with GAF and PtsI domain